MAATRRSKHSAFLRVLALSSVLALAVATAGGLGASLLKAQNSTSSSAATPSHNQTAPATAAPVLPRGKKLMLKDGSFLLVRDYQITGDRVRYYDIDSSQWEQMPADLVDWDATKKIEADQAQRDAAVLSRVHAQEAGRVADPIDIDASLEVAPGIFLPPGESLFAFDGRTVVSIAQADTTSKLSKSHQIEKVLVPIPLITTRYSISIPGAHSKVRLQTGQPEFYLRMKDLREHGIVLARAKIHGDARQVGNVDELFGEQQASADTLPIQRWDVALGVYRFTIGQTLAPGEYAIVEIIQAEGLSLCVWDFAVDGSAAAATPKLK